MYTRITKSMSKLYKGGDSKAPFLTSVFNSNISSGESDRAVVVWWYRGLIYLSAFGSNRWYLLSYLISLEALNIKLGAKMTEN